MVSEALSKRQRACIQGWPGGGEKLSGEGVVSMNGYVGIDVSKACLDVMLLRDKKRESLHQHAERIRQTLSVAETALGRRRGSRVSGSDRGVL